MRRDYTAEEFLSVVKRLRDRIPNIALTTDVITGFCGETDEEFQATYDMMSEVKFDAAFMFKYSPRSGTAAYKRLEDNVPEHVKGERLTAIIDLQKDISMLNNEAYIGRTVNVLVEGQSKKDPEKLYGKTDTFKTTVFPDHPGISAHTIVSVDVTHVSPFTLFGEVR
jgi:tRNA-2-methylthio-N6-dimethylallyladenosine synthase